MPPWFGRLPTSRAGTEAAIGLAFAACRAATLVQILPAIPDGLDRSPRPAINAALLCAVVALSAAMMVVAVRGRRYPGPWWSVADVGLASVSMLAEPLYTVSADRIGSWAVWAPGLSVGVASFAGVAFAKRWPTALVAVLLAGCYAAVTFPGPPRASTVVANCLTYLVFGAVVAVIIGYLRRLGDDADRSRAGAALAARADELDRNRQRVHDAAYLLRMFSGDTTNPVLAGALRVHAGTLANELYAFLDRAGRPTLPAEGEPATLAQVVEAISAAFDDLPVAYVLDLAPSRPLPADTAAATGKALHTLLINVRRHADASRVTVHADGDSGAGTWELAVTDDGKGFDPAITEYGFGLQHQVIAELERVHVATRVVSAPGAGTSVTLTGTWEGREC